MKEDGGSFVVLALWRRAAGIPHLHINGPQQSAFCKVDLPAVNAPQF